MSTVISPSNERTWNYIKENAPSINLIRKGRAIELSFKGKTLFLPSYPEIDSVSLIRKNGTIIPKDIPSNWVAQWKANGSNIRIFAVNDVIIAITRGGYLLDWRPYQSIITSDLKKSLLNAVNNGRYVLFGELVGPKSLVRLCILKGHTCLENPEG